MSIMINGRMDKRTYKYNIALYKTAITGLVNWCVNHPRAKAPHYQRLDDNLINIELPSLNEKYMYEFSVSHCLFESIWPYQL